MDRVIHDRPKNTLQIPILPLLETQMACCSPLFFDRDIHIVADSPIYPGRTPDGLIPCADGAGVIETVGNNSKWEEKIREDVIL